MDDAREKCLKWLADCKRGARLWGLVQSEEYRPIDKHDFDRTGIEAVYSTYSKCRGVRTIQHTWTAVIDIGKVTECYVDVYFRKCKNQKIANQPMRIARKTGQLLIKS